MFEEVSLFKDKETGLYLFLLKKETKNNIVYVDIDILKNNKKVGNLKLKHYLKQNEIEISDFFINSDYRNKGFAKRLYDYAIPIANKKVSNIWAKAFYSAETILKNKNWQYCNNNIYKNKR